MMHYLLTPPIPVMLDIISPDVSFVADSFFYEQVGETVSVSQTLILPRTLPAD
jgi:hypothetical protein